MKIKLLTKILDIILSLGLVALIIWLIIADINPEGTRVIFHSAGYKNPLVDGPKPAERVIGTYGSGKDKYWEIAIDPIYFDLYIPRLYQTIDMVVVYQNEGQNLIELGGLGSSQGWQITLKPGANQAIDELSWPCQEFAGFRVCQNLDRLDREEAVIYLDFNDFVNQIGDSKIMTYHYKFPEQIGVASAGWYKDSNLTDYDYLVTTYFSPKDLGQNWQQMRATFRAEELWLKGHIYKFMISAPGLDQGARLRIKSIKFTLNEEPITKDNLRIKMSRFFKRNLAKIGF